MQPSAFTIKSNAGILNQLTTLVDIVVPNSKTAFQVKAIWDTGATATVDNRQCGKSIRVSANGHVSC